MLDAINYKWEEMRMRMRREPSTLQTSLQWPDTIMFLTKDKRLEVSILNQM